MSGVISHAYYIEKYFLLQVNQGTNYHSVPFLLTTTLSVSYLALLLGYRVDQMYYELSKKEPSLQEFSIPVFPSTCFVQNFL